MRLLDKTKLEKLIAKLDCGKAVSLRDLQFNLGLDGLNKYNKLWDAELKRRKFFEVKPELIKQYDELVKQADFANNKYKPNTKHPKPTQHYQAAIELHTEVIKTDATLTDWFGRLISEATADVEVVVKRLKDLKERAKNNMKKNILLIILILLFSNICIAGTIEDANEALNNKNYSKAFNLYKQEALKGDADAQTKLGDMFYVIEDYAEAVKWYRLAAAQGNAKAQVVLGLMYGKGQGVVQDDAEAAKWFKLAAERGNAEAQARLGGMYYYGRGVAQDYAEAVKWYKLAATQGDANAQAALGFMSSKGLGVTQNNIQAYLWMSLAAEQGNAEAQARLGGMYYEGQGVTQNYAEAVKWYKLAATQGNELGQILLGTMYHIGQGVAQDYVQAYMWLNLAAIKGDKDVVSARDRVASKMTQQQIAEAQKLAREYLDRRSSTDRAKHKDF